MRAFRRWNLEQFGQLIPSSFPAIRAGERRLLRGLLRWADRSDMAFDRRCLHLPPPVRVRAAKPKAQLLTDAEVRRLIAEAKRWSPANAAFAHMIATYGHRPQSLATARVSDFAAGKIRLVVKGGDVVQHALLPKTVRLLNPLVKDRAPDDPLLPSHLGRAWKSGEEFAIWWWPNVGKPTVGAAQAGCYHLKRYAITRMMDVVDAATAASITGHRDPHTLDRYRRTNEAKQAEALAAIGRRPPADPQPRQK
jgi:integrase